MTIYDRVNEEAVIVSIGGGGERSGKIQIGSVVTVVLRTKIEEADGTEERVEDWWPVILPLPLASR